MRLHAICYYRGNSETWTDGWKDEDYRARNLVKAIKKLAFNGHSDFTVNRKSYRVDSTANGQQIALSLVAATLANRIAAAGYAAANIVPIPSSTTTDPNLDFTGKRIADAIQKSNDKLISYPILCFDEEQASSSSGGGGRNSYNIERHLISVTHQPNQPIVLLDDVCSTGAHLIAAARLFRKHGAEVADAFVVGRTALTRPQKMFSVSTEELDTSSAFDF